MPACELKQIFHRKGAEYPEKIFISCPRKTQRTRTKQRHILTSRCWSFNIPFSRRGAKRFTGIRKSNFSREFQPMFATEVAPTIPSGIFAFFALFADYKNIYVYPHSSVYFFCISAQFLNNELESHIANKLPERLNLFPVGKVNHGFRVCRAFCHPHN